MLNSYKHILFVGRIFILPFIAGISGFTTVLHTCAMGGSACCAMTAEDDSDDPGQTTVAKNNSAVRSDFSCMSIKIVGGFTTSSGVLVEKDHVRHYGQEKQINFSEPIIVTASSIPFRYFHQGGPPASRVYSVLTESLRI